MKEAATLDTESRRYISENAPLEWVHGIIYIGARLAQKAMAKGILLATQLTGRAEQSAVSKVHFVSTPAQASALIAQLRAQLGTKVA